MNFAYEGVRLWDKEQPGFRWPGFFAEAGMMRFTRAFGAISLGLAVLGASGCSSATGDVTGTVTY